MGEEKNQDTVVEDENIEENDDIQDDEEQNQEEEEEGAGEEREEQEEGEEKEEDEEEDDEPPVRDKRDFIIKRLQKQRDKYKAKAQEREEEEEEDDDILPEEEKVVEKVIEKKFGDKFAKLEEQEDKMEVEEFVAQNPVFKPYKAKILKYLRHPSRRHLPVKTIAYEVAGDDLLKIGAKKAKQANTKAKAESGVGEQTRKVSGKNVWDMSKEEFEAEVQRVKRGL